MFQDEPVKGSQQGRLIISLRAIAFKRRLV